MSSLTPSELELGTLIVDTLNLSVRPEDINPEGPLYGETLGLDSIDILEISMLIGKKYGIKISSNDDEKLEIFSCLRNLCNYVNSRKDN